MSKLRHRATPGKKSESKNLFISTKAESLVDKVYDSSHAYHATFDQRRGVVTRVETVDKAVTPPQRRSRHDRAGWGRGPGRSVGRRVWSGGGSLLRCGRGL